MYAPKKQTPAGCMTIGEFRLSLSAKLIIQMPREFVLTHQGNWMADVRITPLRETMPPKKTQRELRAIKVAAQPR